jgi:hypothetical protein
MNVPGILCGRSSHAQVHCMPVRAIVPLLGTVWVTLLRLHVKVQRDRKERHQLRIMSAMALLGNSAARF